MDKDLKPAWTKSQVMKPVISESGDNDEPTQPPLQKKITGMLDNFNFFGGTKAAPTSLEVGYKPQIDEENRANT